MPFILILIRSNNFRTILFVDSVQIWFNSSFCTLINIIYIYDVYTCWGPYFYILYPRWCDNLSQAKYKSLSCNAMDLRECLAFNKRKIRDNKLNSCGPECQNASIVLVALLWLYCTVLPICQYFRNPNVKCKKAKAGQWFQFLLYFFFFFCLIWRCLASQFPFP